jgi:hypothetical protein
MRTPAVEQFLISQLVSDTPYAADGELPSTPIVNPSNIQSEQIISPALLPMPIPRVPAVLLKFMFENEQRYGFPALVNRFVEFVAVVTSGLVPPSIGVVPYP